MDFVLLPVEPAEEPPDAPVSRIVGFLAVAPEHYDFLLVESRSARPAVQAFLAALREPATRARIRALGMRPADA